MVGERDEKIRPKVRRETECSGTQPSVDELVNRYQRAVERYEFIGAREYLSMIAERVKAGRPSEVLYEFMRYH